MIARNATGHDESIPRYSANVCNIEFAPSQTSPRQRLQIDDNRPVVNCEHDRFQFAMQPSPSHSGGRDLSEQGISGLKGFRLHFQGFRLSENGGAGASRRHAVDVQRACGERT